MGRLLISAALLAAMIGTASAEYSLALACGFGPVLAGCVPAAVDVYALAAFRAGRDVPAVVIGLVLLNAAAHLVSAGAIEAGVPMIIAVSAVLPLTLWRVHALAEPKCALERPQEPARAPEEPTPVVEIARAEIEAPVAVSTPPEPVSGPPEAPEPPLDETPAPEMDPLLDRAKEIDEIFRRDAGRPAPLRHLQRELKIGQARAQRIRAQLAEGIAS